MSSRASTTLLISITYNVCCFIFFQTTAILSKHSHFSIKIYAIPAKAPNYFLMRITQLSTIQMTSKFFAKSTTTALSADIQEPKKASVPFKRTSRALKKTIYGGDCDCSKY